MLSRSTCAGAAAKPIVGRTNAAVDGAMRYAAVETSLAQLGADLPPQRTPQVLADLLKSEVAKWVPLLRAAGVVAE
jgi:tripartite-type tricarboxylate transporter receptor subunit TctC